MLKAVPPVTAAGVTVILSVALLPESCGLHVIHVTDGFMQSLPILILTILATSTMWTGCVMTCVYSLQAIHVALILMSFSFSCVMVQH